MKRFRPYIALLFLAAYLTAAGGAVWSVLSCPCVALHEHTEHCAHHGHHTHGAACTAASDWPDGSAVEAPCCNHHHAGEKQLYTNADDEKRDRTLREQSLFERCLAVLPVEAARMPERSDERALPSCDRPAPPLPCGHASAWGLRAPPVTA